MIKYPRTYEYLRNVVHLLEHREVKLLAPYIAFFILLSFIPIITLVFEVIFLTVSNNQELINVLSDVLPGHVYTIFVRLIDHNVGAIKILTLSNLVLLFVSSKLYLAFYNSYLIIYNVQPKQFYLRGRIVAFINTLLLIILIFFLSVFTIFNSYIYDLMLNYMDFDIMGYLYNYLNLVLSIMIISSIVTFLMYSVPDIRQKVRDVIQGSLFVTLGWIVVSFGFKIYSDNFADYQTVYKTFTSLIVFVIWIYLISYVLVIGIVLNRAKITTNKKVNIKKNSNEIHLRE
jgi:membrane protein